MDGIIVINKDLGCTSRDVVNIVSKHLNTKKVGHTGTLDPSASGVLVICIGKALKVSELFVNDDKEYIAGVTLGILTDTLDMDGKIIKEDAVKVTEDEIISVLNSFVGIYEQEVPIYSAVKVKGKKLYEYAREGIFVKLPKKMVEIKNIELIGDIQYMNQKVSFNIKCIVSKGTYIRSLIRDIGEKLGTVATMNSLIRTRQGNFMIEDSYTIDDIRSNNYKIVEIMEAFPNIPKVVVDDEMAFKIKNGVVMDKFFDNDLAFIVDKNNNLISLYRNVDNKSRAYKMFI